MFCKLRHTADHAFFSPFQELCEQPDHRLGGRQKHRSLVRAATWQSHSWATHFECRDKFTCWAPSGVATWSHLSWFAAANPVGDRLGDRVLRGNKLQSFDSRNWTAVHLYVSVAGVYGAVVATYEEAV